MGGTQLTDPSGQVHTLPLRDIVPMFGAAMVRTEKGFAQALETVGEEGISEVLEDFDGSATRVEAGAFGAERPKCCACGRQLEVITPQCAATGAEGLQCRH